MSTVIKVENLSKAYQIGQIGTGTISKDLERWWTTAVRGKEDPFLKIGETNDRAVKGTSNIVWSLKDINFEIKQGDAVGIIGRNGAGKSTLLKILSEVTTPTTGKINIKGRVASLLEVGTGFHPELTGRENIFLNGAILGMRKKEIQRKLEQIIDFSGVERYVDTPVKRYSSGMYVRLAFAVAAHLESEILIVDEVLAVGDAEFQKKCLGKMNDVSKGEGRTVLFVSHNMSAMNSLCSNGLYLKNGEIKKMGEITEVIANYLGDGTDLASKKEWDITLAPGDDIVKLLKVGLLDEEGMEANALDFYKGGRIFYQYMINREGFWPIPNIHLFSQKGECVMVTSPSNEQAHKAQGIYEAVATIPPHFLNEGRYVAGMAISTLIPEIIHFYEPEALIFDVIEDMDLRNIDYRGPIPGVIRPRLTWETKKLN